MLPVVNFPVCFAESNITASKVQYLFQKILMQLQIMSAQYIFQKIIMQLPITTVQYLLQKIIHPQITSGSPYRARDGHESLGLRLDLEVARTVDGVEVL